MQEVNKDNPVVATEAKVFYGMIAMFVCACDMGDYLISTPTESVTPGMKDKIKALQGNTNRFLKQITKGLPKVQADAWRKEWEDRDYQVYQAVFNYMTDMTDEQRMGIEEFAKQMTEGKIKIEYSE